MVSSDFVLGPLLFHLVVGLFVVWSLCHSVVFGCLDFVLVLLSLCWDQQLLRLVVADW